jgi:hypothetical protein
LRPARDGRTIDAMAEPVRIVEFFSTLPEKAWLQLRRLAQLGAEPLILLKESLGDLSSLRDDSTQIGRIAKRLDLSTGDASDVLTAFYNLRSLCTRLDATEESVTVVLVKELERRYKLQLNVETTKRLQSLLSESEEERLLEKAEGLQRAFIASFEDAQSVCDVRPVFDESRSRIEGLLLVTLLAIDVADPSTDGSRKITIQLTQNQLKQLRETIVTAERKIEVLEREFGALKKIL